VAVRRRRVRAEGEPDRASPLLGTFRTSAGLPYADGLPRSRRCGRKAVGSAGGEIAKDRTGHALHDSGDIRSGTTLPAQRTQWRRC
jgi:hypothetical protein